MGVSSFNSLHATAPNLALTMSSYRTHSQKKEFILDLGALNQIGAKLKEHNDLHNRLPETPYYVIKILCEVQAAEITI